MPQPYDPAAFPSVAVTVDLVVLTVRAGRLAVLLVERGEAPHRGRLALPGGFLRPDEDLPAAAARELAEETGLPHDCVHLEQLATYGTPGRDPRMRVVTICYLALAPDLPSPVAGTDAASASFVPVDDALAAALAFDHDRLLRDGLERARAKLEYTPLAAAFCPEEFTVAELRRVYEAVWGTPLDPRNFHRKVTGADGFLEPTGHSTTRDGGRPAQLYRRGPARTLHPSMPRSTGDPHPG
ncbi:8-oxo-dGTP diphosphatase [Kineococcus xinjiangensis]|uniref:8-oxo-dGTP diphosphatase n=1 Tax=Kineococcus xinjiangensis TaxID=512762 RepID=A0A2S6IPH2_9ACTN|nr:NUDIX domain-containing protein [Kineococcus xinjiangensis]PPK96108.1 8-oxo-dGTP diphosphatase [Kineococcus xinjiangensis]